VTLTLIVLDLGDKMPKTIPKQIFDNNIRPQDDFFGYINNDWLSKNPVPPSESRWGTFDVLRIASLEAIREIIDELNTTDVDTLSRDQQLLKTFFGSAMSYEINQDNQLATLTQELHEIESLQSQADLPAYLGSSHPGQSHQITPPTTRAK
jgi:predicted metalloendopeptidase